MNTHNTEDIYFLTHSKMFNLTANSKLDFLEEYNSANARMLAPVAAYLVLIMVTGFVGNMLTCYVYTAKFKKTTANCFILCLAILDLMNCVIGLPFELYDLLYEFFFDMPAVCKLVRFVTYMTLVSSTMILVSIALDRYYKICRPLRLSPTSRTKSFVLGSLAIGLFASWPTLFLFGRQRHVTSNPEILGYGCSIDDSVRQLPITTVYYAAVISAILFCTGCLLVLHARVGCAVRRRSRSRLGEVITIPSDRCSRISDCSVYTIATSTDTPCSSTTSTRRIAQGPKYKVNKATVVCVAITVAFLICFGPTLILMICRTLLAKFEESLSSVQYVVYSLFIRSYFLTNAINPFIYGYLNPAYRKQCLGIIGCLKTKIRSIVLCGHLNLDKDHRPGPRSETENTSANTLN